MKTLIAWRMTFGSVPYILYPVNQADSRSGMLFYLPLEHKVGYLALGMFSPSSEDETAWQASFLNHLLNKCIFCFWKHVMCGGGVRSCATQKHVINETRNQSVAKNDITLSQFSQTDLLLNTCDENLGTLCCKFSVCSFLKSFWKSIFLINFSFPLRPR